MRIFTPNLIDAAAVVQTKYSEATAFPASNLRNPQRTKVWRSGTTAALEWTVFDLGSAQAVTACILLNHTLLAGDSLIKIQGNASDSWGAPSFSQTLTWSAGIIAATFASQSFRYWRLTYTKASAGVTRDLGRLFLGIYYTPTDPPDWAGHKRRADSLDLKARGPYGQTFGENRGEQRRPELEWSFIPHAQKIALAAMATALGTVVPFFIQVDETATAGDELSEYQYVLFRDKPQFDDAGFADETKWDTRWNLEESL